MTLLIRPEHRWECPNCTAIDVTVDPQPHTRYHVCPGLRSLTAPMVPAGSRARVYTREREDYVGSDRVQTDGNGRPVASIVTERPDGSNDVAVFAPLAVGSGRAT
ncbi:MAG TPA: hypothetical protein VJZ72_09575 [Candidatus Limnocylindrales bacterium]|nr:hypothetical protein [Candidatus Limnocylindrales bacterium]